MTWLLYANIVLTIFSVCMIGGTIRMHFASKNLHRIQAAITIMEMQQQGDLMWWRKRALDAEGELRRLKEKER